MKNSLLIIVNSLCLFIALLFLSSCQSKYVINQQVNPFRSNHVNYNVFTKIENGQKQTYLGFRFLRNEVPFLYNGSHFTAKLDVQAAFRKNEFESVWDTSFSITKTFLSFDSTRFPVEEKFVVRVPTVDNSYLLYFFVSEAQQNNNASVYYDVRKNEAYTRSEISSIRFYDDRAMQNISLTKQLSRNEFQKPSISFDVSDSSENSPLRVQLFITRTQSDTFIARSIGAMPLLKGSTETIGFKPYEIYWKKALLDTIINERKNITRTFSFLIPDSLKEGTYIAQVQLASGEKTTESQGQPFYIFPDNFPRVRTLKEASQMLKYIAYPYEYKRIISSSSDSLLKNNFDYFWVNLSRGNVEAAKKKIAKFYERINEANIFFSNYKPGWKTDLGMTYILLGTPSYIIWQGTSLQLFYNSKKATENIELTFIPIRSNDNIIGYYLDRSINYEDLWSEYRHYWEMY